MWLPPRIATLDLVVPPALASDIEDSMREIAALDVSHGAHLGALGTMLLRTESVASSKIEQVEATVTEYARALHGVRSNKSAVSMAAATAALEELVASVSGGAELTLDAILRAHHALMHDDPTEAHYAGRLRDVQNWIGGSDHSPRNALYVPPPPETVEDYMSDLLAFTAAWTCRRWCRRRSDTPSSNPSIPSPTGTAASAAPSSTRCSDGEA